MIYCFTLISCKDYNFVSMSSENNAKAQYSVLRGEAFIVKAGWERVLSVMGCLRAFTQLESAG